MKSDDARVLDYYNGQANSDSPIGFDFNVQLNTCLPELEHCVLCILYGNYYSHTEIRSHLCTSSSDDSWRVIIYIRLRVTLAWHIVHDHVEVLVVLECVMQLYNPVRVGVCHDVSLLPEERRVRPLDHLVLGQTLHRIHLFSAFVPHQLHLAKGSASNHLDQTKVFGSQSQIPDVLGQGSVWKGIRRHSCELCICFEYSSSTTFIRITSNLHLLV